MHLASLGFFEQHHRRRRHAPPCPDPSQAFGRHRFEIDSLLRNAEQLRDAPANRPEVRRQARLLSDDRDVAVDEAEFSPRHHSQNFSQQLRAGNILRARIGIGKVAADIALSHGAQKGVDQRMEKHVGVRVARQSNGGRNLDPAEDELSPAAKAVNVEAVADAEITCSCHFEEDLRTFVLVLVPALRARDASTNTAFLP